MDTNISKNLIREIKLLPFSYIRRSQSFKHPFVRSLVSKSDLFTCIFYSLNVYCLYFTLEITYNNLMKNFRDILGLQPASMAYQTFQVQHPLSHLKQEGQHIESCDNSEYQQEDAYSSSVPGSVLSYTEIPLQFQPQGLQVNYEEANLQMIQSVDPQYQHPAQLGVMEQDFYAHENSQFCEEEPSSFSHQLIQNQSGYPTEISQSQFDPNSTQLQHEEIIDEHPIPYQEAESFTDGDQLSYLDELNLAQAPAKVMLIQKLDMQRIQRLQTEIKSFCHFTVQALDYAFSKDQLRDIILMKSFKRCPPPALMDTDLMWKINHRLKKKIVSKKEMLELIEEVLFALAMKDAAM